MFASLGLPRIAVVYANNKAAAGAVVHATANTRHWKSYAAVAEDIAASLSLQGLDVVTMPDGVDLVERLKAAQVELVWLNTGGVQGESPLCQTPALMETAGIPYIGHTPLNAAMLDDKALFKMACSGLGLPTAPFVVHNPAAGRLRPSKCAAFKAAFGSYRGPFIVKPVNGRASQNVEYVETLAQLPGVVAAVGAATQNLVLVERFLGGREFCIAVMGAGPGGVLAFSAVERCLDEGEKVFTSMDVRPITESRVQLLEGGDDPEQVALVEALGELAKGVYTGFNLTSLVRLDIRQDVDGKLYILEANPKPDLKRPSGSTTALVVSGLASQLGWDYDDLIACCIVERLWQLETYKPHMLAHFLPNNLTTADLIRRLPLRVQLVLAPRPQLADRQGSLESAASLEQQLQAAESILDLLHRSRAFRSATSVSGAITVMPAAN